MIVDDLWTEINENEELKAIELDGFIRGRKKGKTMDVPLSEIVKSLDKQLKDFHKVYDNAHTRLIPEMKRALGDIRNQAGCVFLKLLEGGETKRQPKP